MLFHFVFLLWFNSFDKLNSELKTQNFPLHQPSTGQFEPAPGNDGHKNKCEPEHIVTFGFVGDLRYAIGCHYQNEG